MSRDVVTAVGETVDPMSLMQRVCDRTLELIESAERVAIGLTSGRTITYVCTAGEGRSPVGTSVDINSSLSGIVVRTGEIQRSDDTQTDPRVDADFCRYLCALSMVGIPLSRSSETFGVLAVSSSRTHAFSDDDIVALTQLADFVSVAIGSARDLDRVSHQLLNLGRHTNEATGRYVMNVLSPDTVTLMDARSRIAEVFDSPDVLSIVFQPIISLFSSEVVAVEALARFNAAPDRAPNAWFFDAHRAGRGPDLEVLAIGRALSYLSQLPDRVAMSINIGPESVIGSQLQNALEGVEPRRLVLELTEHTAFNDYPGLRTALSRLREQGFRLAVDDAGSGYSSLTHILKLAPDFIKLDRELISGIDVDPVRRALVTSLVAFASDTGAEIVAEGIETRAELDVVTSLGVRYAQGYFLGRPASLHMVDFDRPKPVSGLVGAHLLR